MAASRDRKRERNLQKILELLNKAAFRIQKAKTQEKIFSVTAEELMQFNIQVIFMLFNTQKTSGRIIYVTGEESLKKLKALQGRSLSEFEFPLDHNLFRNLIEKKEASYTDNLREGIHATVPPAMGDISENVVQFLNIADKRAIAAPLVIQNEAVGLLAVISDRITAADIPSVRAFANQVSPALENARLLKESQNRMNELARKLEEQQLLRELNTNLFLAQSRDEVLNAAIEGIHKLGKSFSNISLLNEERTHTRIVRLRMNPKLLKLLEKIGRAVLPGFSPLGYEIPIFEEDNIFHQFFGNQIPLITTNIEISGYQVQKAELPEIYKGLARDELKSKDIIERATKLLPYESLMVFPIVVEKGTIGSLAVTSRAVFSQEDFDLMRTVAEMVSSAMERVIHSEKLTETLDELRAVQKINTLMNIGAPLDQILEHICISIKEVYSYESAYPLLLDSSKKYFTFTYVSVPSSLGKKISKLIGQNLKEFKYPIFEDSFYYNHVIKEKKCIILKGFNELAEEIPVTIVKMALKALSPAICKVLLGSSRSENNLMIAPLPYGEQTIGVLFLGHRKSLTEKDFRRLQHFLDQVGIAIAKSDIEYKLRKSLEELRELDQMKSEFIDIASHELRTPLTTLRLYLEMMALEQYGKLTAPLKERIQIMEEGVTRLEEIINQTLVASRLIKNKLELEEMPVSLPEIAAQVIHQLRPLWDAKTQNIFVESPPDLPLVVGDRKALFTVISDLMDNSIRYSPKNTEILVKFVEHSEEIECMVIDQGCGIPPEHQEKIFHEFYIVPSETEYARMDGRTGLGLFIAKGIIERHNGKIWVESTVGEGSTFCFTVPKE
ncbi:MAG: hypothetical protein HXS46_08715 [Theionarchaea archaeon]|nr:MAG: hypothetical protein AYK18_01655 [Theionarchaea archaeon DG-70]MBU7010759.1 hypothetical protein [Theionarchaea archaeon]